MVNIKLKQIDIFLNQDGLKFLERLYAVWELNFS